MNPMGMYMSIKAIFIYIYMYIFICIHIYIYINILAAKKFVLGMFSLGVHVG